MGGWCRASLPWGGESPDPPPRPPETPAQWGGDRDVLWPGGVEVWAPHSVFPVTNKQRCQGEVQASYLVFAGMGGSGATVFSTVFDWSAVGTA